MNITVRYNEKEPQNIKAPFNQKKPIVDIKMSDDSGNIYWSFTIIDAGGKWGFKEICKTRLHDLITSEFKNKEGTTWKTLKENGSHNISCDKLVKDARRRLEDIHLDDKDELFSLRFSGKERLWGIREGNVLRVLWWDPKHEVCESQKRHT